MRSTRIAEVHAALERRPKYRGKIRALGLTVPGLVRSDGLVVHLPVLGWKNVKLLQLAAAEIETPLFIENNTNAAAFGEVYTHPGPNRDFIVYLKLGIGCGGAAILNGRLMRGGRGTAAEFGHMRVADDGPLCSCGRRGCLETFVNLAALAAGFAPDREVRTCRNWSACRRPSPGPRRPGRRWRARPSNRSPPIW